MIIGFIACAVPFLAVIYLGRAQRRETGQALGQTVGGYVLATAIAITSGAFLAFTNWLER